MIEREVKLAASPAFRLPDLGAVDGLSAVGTEPQRFHTVYVDTPDLRVARWGCSLRHREGQGWTLKLPPSEEDETALVRSEHGFPGDAKAVPAEATDLLRAYVRSAELRPIVRLRTIRRRLELRSEERGSVGEIVDDEVSVMEGQRVAARFRELEVEIDASVPDDVLGALVAELRRAGAGAVDNTPKYLRALGSLAEGPAEVVVPDIGAGATVADVVRVAIGSSVIRLLRHDAGVRLGEDPEQVHQARVATRRLRSDLRTFREIVDPDWGERLRSELQRLGQELGAVRDAEVLRDRLRDRARGLPERDAAAAERLIAQLVKRRDLARDELLTGIRSDRYVHLLDRLVAASAEPVLQEGVGEATASTLATVMERPWGHLRRAVRDLGPEASNEELHGVRIRAKRARYAAEAVAPVFGKKARAFARGAADLQDVLGEHQDAVVAGEWLRDSAGGGARQAFVAGELAALELGAAKAARAAFPGAWKALSRKRLQFWT